MKFQATKKLKLFAYKMKKSQALKPGDEERRLRMCRYFVRQNATWFKNLFMSDELRINLNGTLHSMNHRDYAPRGSKGNPHFRTTRENFAKGILFPTSFSVIVLIK